MTMLFSHQSPKEYLFVHSLDDSHLKQLIYYVSDKVSYNQFLKALPKIPTVEGSGLGRVYYDNGKKYYRIIIIKKSNSSFMY